MYLKRYTIASFILMLIIGWYVYSFVSQDSISLTFLGYTLPSIPIALAVVLPLMFLYIASFLHMGFYSFLGALKLKKYEKDYNKLLNFIGDSFLQKDKTESIEGFLTSRYKLLGKIVTNSKIFPNVDGLLDIENDKLKKVLEVIKKIQDGEYVNLKRYSLSNENPFVIQNLKNGIKSGEVSVEDIIKNSSSYSDSIVKFAFETYLQKASSDDILKHKDKISKDNIFKIIDRIDDEENQLKFSNEEIVDILFELKLDCDTYIKVAKSLSKKLLPEPRLKVFEKLSEKDEQALSAYIYTALDLEMLDLAKEILESTTSDDFQKFRAFLYLRECGKNYSIDMFI